MSKNLFLRLSNDIDAWKKDTTSSRNDEKVKFVEGLRDKRNYIDTWHIPIIYKDTAKCRAVMHKVCHLINKLYGEKIVNDDGQKSSSIRCYKNYESAIRQLSINFLHL